MTAWTSRAGTHCATRARVTGTTPRRSTTGAPTRARSSSLYVVRVLWPRWSPAECCTSHCTRRSTCRLRGHTGLRPCGLFSLHVEMPADHTAYMLQCCTTAACVLHLTERRRQLAHPTHITDHCLWDDNRNGVQVQQRGDNKRVFGGFYNAPWKVRVV